MHDTSADLDARIRRLERGHCRDRMVIATLAVLIASFVTMGATRDEPQDLKIRTLDADRVVVRDHRGRVRITLGEDPADTQRRSRSCGLNIYDATGAERGGMSTMEDLSVVLGMDAPTGVGAPMRDRIGLVVSADGSASIDLINNETMLPVRLVSEADGSGGVEFFDYDLETKRCTVTRMNHEGQTQRVIPLGDG